MLRTDPEKLLIGVGYAFLLIYLTFSLWYYQERMIPFDSGFYLFMMVHLDEFFTGHDRWISYLPQALPYVLHQLGASLFVVMLSYSFLLAAFHGIAYIVLHKFFRQPQVGIYLCLCLVLTMRYKFYIGVSETPLTMSLVALFIGWHRWYFKDATEMPSAWRWGILVVLLLLLTGGHPVMIIPVFAYLGLDTIWNQRWFQRDHWIVVATTAITYYLRIVVFADGYESEKAQIDSGRLSEVFLNADSFKVWEIIGWYFDTEYHVPAVAFVVTTVVLVLVRRFLSAGFLMLCTLVVIGLVANTYAYLNGTVLSLIDGHLGLLGMIWALPVIYLHRSGLPKLNVAWVVGISGLLLFSLVRIQNKHEFFTYRLDRFRSLMEANGYPAHRKFLIGSDLFDWDKEWYYWAIPYETLLLTSLQGRDYSATIFYNTWTNHEVAMRRYEPDIFLGTDWDPLSILPFTLDQDYFYLPWQSYLRIDTTLHHPPKRRY